MARAPLFNVRCDEDLLDAIEAAAADAGLRKSVWAREVLAAVAYGGISMERLTAIVRASDARPDAHPVRFLALQGQTGRQTEQQRECQHPRPSIKRLPFTDLCGACGATLGRRGGSRG